MISINGTVVNIALPSIRLDLRFSENSLVWVVNAYLITYGGFLLLGGRLGDFFGRRRLFLLGVMLFTLASLGCGLATSPRSLVAARSAQGLGSAIVSAVALSQIMNLFTEATKRAKALGIYVFVGAGGGSLGLLLGGGVTSALSWHWIFLVNVPIGVGVYALCVALLPRDARNNSTHVRLDVAGAATAIVSMMLAVYAIVNGNHVGWSSSQTLAVLAIAGGLLALFVRIESKAQTPLMPLALFRIRNLAVVNISGVFLAAAMLAWSYISALYLQLVLQLNPLEVGLVCLPANLAIAVMSVAVSPTLVMRFGIKRTLVSGMLIAGVGLALLARAPMSANVVLDVLPGILFLGLGAGMAYNPLLLSALGSVALCNSGAASGIINTTFTMGGALGLSVLASIADARTSHLLASGADLPLALSGGYQLAFCIGAVFATLAALISGAFLRDTKQQHQSRKNVCNRTLCIRDDAKS